MIPVFSIVSVKNKCLKCIRPSNTLQVNSNGLRRVPVKESGFFLFFIIIIRKSWAAKTLIIQIYAFVKHIQQGRVLIKKLNLLCLVMSNVLIMIYDIDMILLMV